MDAQWINYSPPSNTTPTTLPPGADAQVTLAIEPESKEVIIRSAIQGAKHSIWIEMYQFTDPNVATDLLTAASQGIDVQVLYEAKNAPNVLFSAGQQVLPSWARPNPAVDTNGNPIIHHAKFMIIDGGIIGQEKAYIMTANFTGDALGGTWQRTNREYIICDTDHQDISVLMAIFSADQHKTPFQPPMASNLITTTPNLIVSAVNAHQQVRALLDSAKQSIIIQSEVLNDPNTGSLTAQALSIEGALANAAQLGVKDIRVMLPPQGTTDWTIPNSCPAINNLKATPTVQIKTSVNPYVHAKLIIIDQRLAYVGSHNLDRASLSYNREVGIIIVREDAVQALCATFESDWQGAQPVPTSACPPTASQ